jgi:UDP-N-acetylmuramyl pentapeptide phosphotransferase/UDP-N-acetylglucosamine-1-phosphate transferase
MGAMGWGILLVAVIPFTVSCALTRILARPVAAQFLLDHPDHRSLHKHPTSRGGGIAIICGVLAGAAGVALLVPMPNIPLWIGLAALVIVSVSFLDDLSHVHPGVRISVHFIVAAGLMFVGLGLEYVDLPAVRWQLPAAIMVVVSCLFVVWLVNLYNFMDGMDGFAAGMAIFGFGTFAVLGTLAENAAFTALNIVVAAAAGGFLVFNFPPARIFMGDVGSSLLGLLAAGFSLWATAERIFPLWVAVLVFSPFITDATFTLLRRLFHRERVWDAHKTHCYQRLVELGWGHQKTVLWEYALMALCAISAIVAVHLRPIQQWLLLAVWVVAYAILIGVVARLEARQGTHEPLQSL